MSSPVCCTVFSNKYPMSSYYAGYLPQGVHIVSNLNDSHRYILPRSQTFCFPFRIKQGAQQITVDLANTTPFENVYVPGIRSWPSIEPAGNSMTASPRSSEGSINLPPNGIKWNFWLINLQGQIDLEEANVHHWINGSDIYWINVQNLQNRENNFWCRFTYQGPGLMLEE